MNKVLVVMPVSPEHKKSLTEAAPSSEFVFVPAGQVSEELAKSADVIIGNISPKLIRGSENLKWLQLNSAGTDGYLEEGVLPKDAVLTNASGAYGLAISEHMLASLLCLMKNLDLYAADQKDHVWKDHGPVTSIYGTKTVVVGMGDIGSEFAMRMNALGSHVTGIRKNTAKKPDYVEKLCTMEQLKECLADADIVASCLPGTPETFNLYNAELFGCMKKGAFFINIGRGAAVDSKALEDALESGQLSGAAIDVTNPEPLPPEHSLWNAPNLLITPHVSGGYHLPETHNRIVRIAAENLKLFLAGEPLKNEVDFQTGYRKNVD